MSAQNALEKGGQEPGRGTSEKVGGLPPLFRNNRSVPPNKSKSRLPSPSKSAGATRMPSAPRGSEITEPRTPDPRLVMIRMGDTTRSINPSALKSPQAGWKFSGTLGSSELTGVI